VAELAEQQPPGPIVGFDDDVGPNLRMLCCIHMRIGQLNGVYNGVSLDEFIDCGGCNVLRVACSGSVIHAESVSSSLISVGSNNDQRTIR
jgi:hypothetical protein